MTRRISLTVFGLSALFALALASACGPDAMEGFERYENDKEGFAIQYPADWEPLHGTGALVTFMAPAEPGFPGRANVTVTAEPVPSNMTPEAYLDQAKPLLAQVLPKYEFTGQDTVTVNGVDGVRFTYLIEVQGHPMSLVGYALLSGDRAYVLTAGALADRFGNYAEIFDRICRSMEIQ